MTVVIACALLAILVLLNWVVLKRSAGLTDLLWIIGGFYLLSFLYNVTMIDELAWEAVDGVWQGGSASGMLGRPSKTLDWLLWLNWMSLLVLITSFFRVDRAADAARDGDDLGKSNLRGFRSASKSQITARPSGAGGLGNISFDLMPPLRGGHAGSRQK